MSAISSKSASLRWPGGRLCSTVAPFGGNEAETWRYWLKVRVAVTSTDEDVDVLEALLPVDVTHRRRRNF